MAQVLSRAVTAGTHVTFAGEMETFTVTVVEAPVSWARAFGRIARAAAVPESRAARIATGAAGLEADNNHCFSLSLKVKNSKICNKKGYFHKRCGLHRVMGGMGNEKASYWYPIQRADLFLPNLVAPRNRHLGSGGYPSLRHQRGRSGPNQSCHYRRPFRPR